MTVAEWEGVGHPHGGGGGGGSGGSGGGSSGAGTNTGHPLPAACFFIVCEASPRVASHVPLCTERARQIGTLPASRQPLGALCCVAMRAGRLASEHRPLPLHLGVAAQLASFREARRPHVGLRRRAPHAFACAPSGPSGAVHSKCMHTPPLHLLLVPYSTCGSLYALDSHTPVASARVTTDPPL